MDCLSLISLNSGESCRIEQIVAGRSATKRLYEMGFNKGAQVKVLKNDRGPMIVALCGHKVALGRGLAEKMLVGRLQ